MSVDAALPEFGSGPGRAADLGRRIRFVIYTAILVVLICLAASLLSPSRDGHHGRGAHSSAHVAPRASIGNAAPVARTNASAGRTE